MELHSYAKRKTAKKWTIEHKRKLVEARIHYDVLFEQKPTNSVVPWKAVLSLAKLDDYNVFFVRKQWSIMVARYKSYKQAHVGNAPAQAIDDDMVRKITTKEWEFFEPIHRFMTRKTTNLHSYASQEAPPPGTKSANLNKTKDHQQQHQPNSTSSEHINLFSSDTNEDYAAALGNSNQFTIQNTDHDLYSKREATAEGPYGRHYAPMSYFADASDDTQESIVVELTTTPMTPGFDEEIIENKPFVLSGNVASAENKVSASTQNPITNHQTTEKQEGGERDQEEGAAAALSTAEVSSKKLQNGLPLKLSERDKYYRHKRRFNHRLERRFDSILNVFGQIVKAEYPSIDVSPLIGAAAASRQLVGRLFSSDEDVDDDGNGESAAENAANHNDE